jgi:UV DNA damage repair endonuclease
MLLSCSFIVHLGQILRYNAKNNLLFFRISSDLIPFASHPICKLSWCRLFQSEFEQIGDYIKQHDMRISMHPDQFVVLNSPNSINELRYHSKIHIIWYLFAEEDVNSLPSTLLPINPLAPVIRIQVLPI